MRDNNNFAEAIDGKNLSRTGRQTAARILEAAYDILRTEGYEKFSMQGIARRLDIRLSNVQYYFSSRRELIKALMRYVHYSYMQRYREKLEQAEDTPEARFRTLLEFNYDDVAKNDTRHFFIQLWLLLSIADNYTGELLQQLYENYLREFTEIIREMVPGVSPEQARVRAEIIAAMLEGLMVTAPASVDSPEHRETLREGVLQNAMAIARGQFPG